MNKTNKAALRFLVIIFLMFILIIFQIRRANLNGILNWHIFLCQSLQNFDPVYLKMLYKVILLTTVTINSTIKLIYIAYSMLIMVFFTITCFSTLLTKKLEHLLNRTPLSSSEFL